LAAKNISKITIAGEKRAYRLSFFILIRHLQTGYTYLKQDWGSTG